MILNEKQKRNFVKKVELSADGCAYWTGATCTNGYGQFVVNKRSFMAHRVSYLEYIGEIGMGLHLDHVCRNRSCVLPSHLRPVTPRVNAIQNSKGPTAINAAKTHCIHGHEFNSLNTRYTKIQRVCRTCERINGEKKRIRNKQN